MGVTVIPERISPLYFAPEKRFSNNGLLGVQILIMHSVHVYYWMNTLKAESDNPTLLTVNRFRAVVAWVLKATLLHHDTLGKAGGMIKAHAVSVPSDSVLAPLYVGADLLDAFAIHLPAGASDDLEVLARAAFERQAGWIRALTGCAMR